MTRQDKSGNAGNVRNSSDHTRAWRHCIFFILIGLSFLTLSTGCTRKFFRQRADRDVDAMLEEKNVDPRWAIEQFHIYPDPRARYADDTNPDRPPMPPDDPPARELSPTPQKPPKTGIGYIVGKGYLEMLAIWDAENRQELEQDKAEGGKPEALTYGPAGESPANAPLDASSAIPDIQRELSAPVAVDRPLPLTKKDATEAGERQYLIKLDQSVELGFINSREFQTQREQLYLAALPLTVERFAFAAQFFALERAFRDIAGRDTAVGKQNRWTFDTQMGFTKLLSTGGLILAQFTNFTSVNLGSFSGRAPIKTTSQSVISLDIIQPFLRGGGRAVTLEPLTQAERNLLYTVRDYARFRQQFYVYIAAGQPQFIPGVTAGVAALTPGTVTTPAPFVPLAAALPQNLAGPFIQPQVTPAQGGRQSPIGPSAPTPIGFYNLVSARASLTNQYKNVQALQRYLNLFRVYLEGGIVNPVQVGQVEQNLLNSIEQVLNQQASYRTNLDQFKLQLGLPTTLPLALDDEPLRPMFRQEQRYEDISNSYLKDVNESLRFGKAEEAGQLRERLTRLMQSSGLLKGTQFQKTLQKQWAEWAKLPKKAGAKDPVTSRLDGLQEERRKLLDKKSDLESKNQKLPEKDDKRLDQLDAEVELGLFERILRIYETQPWKEQANPVRAQEMQAFQFISIHRLFISLLEGAYLERSEKIRESWPALPELCVEGIDVLGAEEEVALNAVQQAALINRLDVMNQRAQLVDAWRKIAVTANSLLGIFNVEYHLDTSTPAEMAQPFNLGGSRWRHELVFNAQPPIVRRVERNNYRSDLIAFQQQRRALMAAEDNVLFAVRSELRSLRSQANNYQRIQKRNIELAYSQVGQALEAFNQPQTPQGGIGVPGIVGPPVVPGGGGDPAALTTQLLNAQQRLVSAQNGLYNIWISYLGTRMALYRDMGLMPLDGRGVWLDDIAKCNCNNSERSNQPGSERKDGDHVERLPEPRTLPPAESAPAGKGR